MSVSLQSPQAIPKAPKRSRKKASPLPFIGGPRPTHAYGLVLTDENLRHFAKVLLEFQGRSLSPDLSPREMEEQLDATASICHILGPDLIYRLRPNMPRVRKAIIIVSADDSWEPMFVLKDNGSEATLNAKTAEEDIRAMKELLHIPEDTQPAWHPVCQEFWPFSA